MSANVENMFFVGERNTPWHGLGVELDNPPTSKDAIVAAGLDWTVDKQPIFDQNGNEIPGYVANTRSSDNSILGIVSERYKIVQNSEAFDFVDDLVDIDSGMTYETAGSLRDGKQIWLLGKMPKTTILGDQVDPYVCFTNTHDGTGAIRVCMTPVRVVCNNTLNFALETAKRSWSTRHIGDITLKLREAQITLGLIDEYMSSLDLECQKLAETKLSDMEIEAILDSMYPVDADTSDLTKRRIDEIKTQYFNCLEADDISQFRGTAYSAMMAATDHADHSKPIRATKNFDQNRWAQIIVGHIFVDTMLKQIRQIAA